MQTKFYAVAPAKAGRPDRIANTEGAPESSLEAIFQYGWNHYLGNVVAQKLVQEVRTVLGKERNVKPTATYITKEDIARYRDANPEWVVDTFTKLEAEAEAAFYAGTIGVREVGISAPRDPVTARVKKLVMQKLLGILKSKNVKLPKDDSVIVPWGRETRTRTQFVENAWNSYAEELRPIAIAQLEKEEEDRKAALAKEMAKADVETEEEETFGI